VWDETVRDGGVARVVVTCAPPETGVMSSTVDVTVDGAPHPFPFDLNATVAGPAKCQLHLYSSPLN
jgi:hypothetical protein